MWVISLEVSIEILRYVLTMCTSISTYIVKPHPTPKSIAHANRSGFCQQVYTFVQHFKFTKKKAQNVTFHDQNKTKKHFTLTQ